MLCAQNIILKEGDMVITDTEEICNIFNTLFSTIADTIGKDDSIDTTNTNFIEEVISRHCKHSSVLEITKIMKEHQKQNFYFETVDSQSMKKYLQQVKVNKATGYDNIPARMVQMCDDEMCMILTNVINKCFHDNTFPEDMKKAEISPMFKKSDDMNKNNYRPVSILTTFNKVFETIIAKQLTGYFDTLFNKMLCAYRKKYACDHILIRLIDLWKWSLDRDQFVGTLLMDLSKAFDCIPHGLLICKLRAYGVSEKACIFLSTYLSGRYQRVKVENSRSSWAPVKKGIPQGSCLGPLLFNIFINDIFCFITKCDLFNYADDNTLSKSAGTVELVIEALKTDANNAIKWFEDNNMKANPEKFQIMLLKPMHCQTALPLNVDINDMSLEIQNNVKLLGITIDDKLKFDIQVNNMCSRASRQLNVMYRFQKIFKETEKRIIYNTFIVSNFNYCPIVWTFCGIVQMRKMEKIQERALRYVFDDASSEYLELLKRADSDMLHLKRIKTIACEVFKTLNDHNPIFMKEMFTEKQDMYGLRDNHKLVLKRFKKMKYGRNSFSYYGAHIWNLLPPNFKECVSVSCFKKLLSTWEGPSCTCSMCDFMP